MMLNRIFAEVQSGTQESNVSNSTGLPVLLPSPQKCRRVGDRFTLPTRGYVCLPANPDGSVMLAGEKLISAINRYGKADYELSCFEGSPAGHIRLRISDKRARHPQGYLLSVSRDDVTVEAGTSAGLFYGTCTLIQLIRQYGRRLAGLRIEDWPDIEQRGVMLDVSRDAVPKMDRLLELVDLLAELKVNHLQLYTEHTFAYEGHETVWRDASPITPSELLRLQRYCRERHIQLVPNQNSFGHMERWLNHKEYEYLAECAGPPTRPGSRNRCLAPVRPGSIKLLQSLYEQLLPHFESRLFNIGCDETWQLGEGASRSACKRKGEAQVYLQYLLKLYRLAKRHGKTPMVWADMIVQYPEILAQVPADMVMLVWKYELHESFEQDCRLFARQGLDFYVCPGTSNWLALGGRTDNCICNLAAAAKAAVEHGAAGFLNTDWRDKGRQYLTVSYLGYAYGAGVSWAYRSNRSDHLLLDRMSLHVFEDKRGKLGRVFYDLGKLDEKVCRNPINHSSLYVALQGHLDGAPFWDYEITLEGWRDYSVSGARKALSLLKRYAGEVEKAKPSCPDGKEVILELRQIINQFAHACHKVMVAHQLRSGKASRGELRSAIQRQIRDLSKIKQRHRQLWPARNRPGGLKDSLATFDKVVQDYRKVLNRL